MSREPSRGEEYRWHEKWGWHLSPYRSKGRWLMMPGQGRHGRRTPWWVFSLHLLMVLVSAVTVALAISEGMAWLSFVAAAVWGWAFVMAALDNVRIPVFDHLCDRVSRWFDRLREMRENRKTADTPSEESEE